MGRRGETPNPLLRQSSSPSLVQVARGAKLRHSESELELTISREVATRKDKHAKEDRAAHMLSLRTQADKGREEAELRSIIQGELARTEAMIAKRKEAARAARDGWGFFGDAAAAPRLTPEEMVSVGGAAARVIRQLDYLMDRPYQSTDRNYGPIPSVSNAASKPRRLAALQLAQHGQRPGTATGGGSLEMGVRAAAEAQVLRKQPMEQRLDMINAMHAARADTRRPPQPLPGLPEEEEQRRQRSSTEGDPSPATPPQMRRPMPLEAGSAPPARPPPSPSTATRFRCSHSTSALSLFQPVTSVYITGPALDASNYYPRPETAAAAIAAARGGAMEGGGGVPGGGGDGAGSGRGWCPLQQGWTRPVIVIEPLPELSDAELDVMLGIEPPAPVERRPSSSSPLDHPAPPPIRLRGSIGGGSMPPLVIDTPRSSLMRSEAEMMAEAAAQAALDDDDDDDDDDEDGDEDDDDDADDLTRRHELTKFGRYLSAEEKQLMMWDEPLGEAADGPVRARPSRRSLQMAMAAEQKQAVVAAGRRARAAHALRKVRALRKVATAATATGVVTELMSTDSLEGGFGAKEGAMSKQVHDMSTSGAFAKRCEEGVAACSNGAGGAAAAAAMAQGRGRVTTPGGIAVSDHGPAGCGVSGATSDFFSRRRSEFVPSPPDTPYCAPYEAAPSRPPGTRLEQLQQLQQQQQLQQLGFSPRAMPAEMVEGWEAPRTPATPWAPPAQRWCGSSTA